MERRPLIASSRMYNVSEGVRPLWDALFDWLGAQARVPLTIVAHAAPAPLSDLWERPDLGAVFICGYPLAKWQGPARPEILAAPVADAPWAMEGPNYASHIIVAKDGPISDPGQLASAIWGWTVRDSQSGYHAPRAFYAAHWPDHPTPWTVGPLLNPTGVIEALRRGRIEVGAIDAYAYKLLELHEPEMLAGVEVIATSAPTPCPVLACAEAIPAPVSQALREALLHVHDTPEGRALLAPLGLRRFAPADLADYALLPRRATETDQRLAIW
ncbi:phosphate/phosphite/phosphonate ABC transporter substrate-binding protein [Paracoccus aminophilus]|uniref:ABC-type phosphate/phosphonate transport system, periplasmic component n=1 Tax=Paracoccus aminophilus JCM 7686 TaxID=1367847 RepID=S5YUL5_PARAH|nr:PhnD/SsuA/transferrin family substrate-binding protein [Paracoccus aminophilus]AGT08926.1 ABC-type phosphate/phosphonate transport system, periplasmic component [Paracoccus aminophilus JCM 7686]